MVDASSMNGIISAKVTSGLSSAVMIAGIIFVAVIVLAILGYFIWYNKQFKYTVIIKQKIKDNDVYIYTDKARIWRDEFQNIVMKLKSTKKEIRPVGIKDIRMLMTRRIIELVQIDFDNYAPEQDVNFIVKDKLQELAFKDSLYHNMIKDENLKPYEETLSEVLFKKKTKEQLTELERNRVDRMQYLYDLSRLPFDDIEKEADKETWKKAAKQIRKLDMYMNVSALDLVDFEAKITPEPIENKQWHAMKVKEFWEKYMNKGFGKYAFIILLIIFMLIAVFGNYIFIKQASESLQQQASVLGEANRLIAESNQHLADVLLYLSGNMTNGTRTMVINSRPLG